MAKDLRRNKSILICLLLTVTTAVVFCQVYRHDFISYDDNIYVYDNPDIKDGLTRESVKWAFTTDRTGNWHPLTWLSHILDWQLFGANPAGHHITNLILHVANTLLLFIILKRMTGALWQSAFVAALFALHPLHVESVAWVAERKDVLSTFFWFLTMAAYLRYVKQPNFSHYVFVILSFLAGLMAKPMLVTLPFVLLLLDYWPLGRVLGFNRERFCKLILEKIPLFVLSAASSVVTFIMQRGSGAVMPVTLVALKLRIFNALISYVKYIEKMVWPSQLAILYPYHIWDLTVLSAVVSLAFLLAISVFVFWLASRGKYMVTGWLWFLGTLLPVIGLVQVGSQRMADRYSYVTLIGLFIIIAWGVPKLLEKWRYKRVMLAAAGVVVVSAMSVCTYVQLRYWRNNITLFGHAIDVTEGNHIAHFHLADAFYKRKRFGEAIEQYRKFIEIIPDNAGAFNGLGFALARQGNFDEAIRYLNEALRINGDFAKAHANLSYALERKGRLNEARLHLREAVRLDPNLAMAHYLLGVVLMKTGETDEAFACLDESLRLRPDWAGPMNDLAWYLATSKNTKYYDPERAIVLAERACELSDYKKPEFLDTLAVAYAAKGDFSKAIEVSGNALELCRASGREAVGKEIESHLILFKAGKPYAETQ